MLLLLLLMLFVLALRMHTRLNQSQTDDAIHAIMHVCIHKSNRHNIPILVPSGVVDDVAVLGYGLVSGLACER